MSDEDPYHAGQTIPNAADPGQVRAQAKVREWIGDEQANDLRAVYQTPEGKRLLIRLLEESRVMLDPYSGDALEMARGVGAQLIGRRLIEWLNKADPEAFPRLLLQRLADLASIEANRQSLLAQGKSINAQK